MFPDSLPIEIICLIASNLLICKDMLSLMRCNHLLYDAAIHVLYKQDSQMAHYALHWLIQGGFKIGVQHVISRNNLDLNVALAPRKTSINTPLLLAIGFCHTNIVDLLLRNGALVNLGTDVSALEYAATLGDYNIISLLLQHGAHVNLVGAIRGLPPLECVLEVGCQLPTSYPDSLHRDDWDDLFEHKENEFVRVIQLLLAHGADPLFQDAISKSTCLHRVPRVPWKSTEKVASLLLAAGAVLDAQDLQGDTPLHIALTEDAFRGDTNAQKEFVTLLLRSGADVNLENEKEELPLGISFENPDIWKLFLQQEANTRSHGKTGDQLLSMLLRIPLQKQTRDTKQHFINNLLIEILVEHGACADNIIDGRCPLDRSAAKRYPVLQGLRSKRTVTPMKPVSTKSSKAKKHSGSIRKPKNHKKSTRRLPSKTTRNA